jgi:hypothetical protein
VILIEALAAGIVGVALLWLVLQPLLLPVEVARVFADIPDPEETPRGQALLALKEIEFDRATGKLSDEDFTALHARYTTAALATLASEETAGDRVEAPVADRAAASGERLFCSECGTRLPAGAKFCADCGTSIR